VITVSQTDDMRSLQHAPLSPDRTNSMEEEVLLERLIVPQLVKCPSHFMEPQGSLLSSQQHATFSYPEPDK
jgi:hypothetical protein